MNTDHAPSQPLRLSTLGLRLEPIAVAAVGDGRAVFLRAVPAANDVLCPLSMDHLRIEETRQVPTLLVHNPLKRAVAMISNIVLSGGWQTRTIERSTIVPAESSVRIPVKCVEAGRWGGGGRRFRGVDRVSLDMREELSMAKSMRATRTGEYAADQSRVWSLVDEELTKNHLVAPSRSYEVVTDNVRRKRRETAARESVEIPKGANAVLLCPAGGGAWLEALASEEALRDHASTLLADLYEADRAPRAVKGFSVEKLLDWLVRRRVKRLEPVEGAAGDSFAVVSSRAAGEALFCDGALVHAAIAAPTVTVSALPCA